MSATESAAEESMTLAELNDAASMDVHRAGLLLDVLDNYIYEGEGQASETVVEMLRTVRGILTQASDRLDYVELGLRNYIEPTPVIAPVVDKVASKKAVRR